MSNVNQQSLRHLDQRMAVHPHVMELLGRARGLSLLPLDRAAEEVTELRHPSAPLGMGETNQGVDFTSSDTGDLLRVVLVTKHVNYPIAGYPEAYSE